MHLTAIHRIPVLLCSDSQTFEADTLDEVNQKIKEFKKNFLDENWLKENIDI